MRSRRRVARYAIVGALNTTITFAVYSVLVVAGVGYVAALVVGYAAGLVTGFTLNRQWTFRVLGAKRRQMPRYLLVQGTGLLANLAVLALLIEVAGTPAVLAQGVALFAVFASTYLLNRHWTFRHDGGSAPAAR